MAFNLLDAVFNLARAFHTSPTVILSNNIDTFITCLNYFNIKEEKEAERKMKKFGIAPKGRDNFMAFL